MTEFDCLHMSHKQGKWPRKDIYMDDQVG
jgi:hypothetical protein